MSYADRVRFCSLGFSLWVLGCAEPESNTDQIAPVVTVATPSSASSSSAGASTSSGTPSTDVAGPSTVPTPSAPVTSGAGGNASSGGAESGQAGEPGADVDDGPGAAGEGSGQAGTQGSSSDGGSGGAPPLGAGGASAGMSAGGVSSGGGDGGAAESSNAGESSGGAGGAPSAESPLPPIEDYAGDGPFETTIESNVGPGGGYTVFRPEPLGADGFLHAPIIFGPGIGQSVTVHTEMLSTFASHGFVVVGTPVLEGGPGDEGNRQSMLDGLDWIIEQNDSPGTYQGKLDTLRAVSMGFSVGGTSAVEIGGHPSVATVVSIHGHRATAELHGPMLQTTGTEDTVGMPLQQQTYDMSNVPTFLATLTGAPHQYIERDGGGEERSAIVAWMRYFVYADEGARNHFYGDDCVLCAAPWENPQRKNWE